MFLSKFCLQDNELYSSYPYHIFPQKKLYEIKFSNITIFYGNNGSGKTTLLKIIGKKIGSIVREENNTFNSVTDWNIVRYIEGCNAIFENNNPREMKTIFSEDIFDFIIDKRIKNEKKQYQRVEVAEEWNYSKYRPADYSSYESLKKSVEIRKKSRNQYIKSRVQDDEDEFSNGQTAIKYFDNNIMENGLYLLDEPENSLSPEFQFQLMQLITEMARFFNCQFIISTHSPFILSLEGAKIYNLDAYPVDVEEWYELPNVQLYYNFFDKHRKLFENKDKNS